MTRGAKDATVTLDGTRVDLFAHELLGEGGEGRVYRAGGRAVKIYASPPDAARVAKLRAFPPRLPSAVVGPTSLATNDRGDVVGYAMRLLPSAFDARKLSERRFRDGAFSNSDVCALFSTLASALGDLHRRGVMVGDLNDGNVVVTRENKPTSCAIAPWVIDADSMQYTRFPCPVAHERFLDPCLYGKDLARAPSFTEATDWYALSVMAFSSLLYVHPYGGIHAAHATMLRRAEARYSALRGDVVLPRSAACADTLTDDMLAYFTDTFDHGARRAFPATTFSARWTRCTCGAEHARARCPVCTQTVAIPRAAIETRGCRAETIFTTRGRIVSAEMQKGALSYVYEEDRVLHRDGGTKIAAPDTSPVREESGQLIRNDGARIGPVLSGLTWVRTGDRMGVAFYRVSGLTVWCVFDVAKGGLRNVDLPPIRGKLTSAECVFDGENALISVGIERDGHVVHAAHMITLGGAILATEEGPPESNELLERTTGKCVRGDHVLTASDRGLALFRVDPRARAFTCVRRFPETRAWVSGGPDLFAGGRDSAGCVFVVHSREIVKLSLTSAEQQEASS